MFILLCENWRFNLQTSEKLWSQNIVRHESGRNIGHEMVVTLEIYTRK